MSSLQLKNVTLKVINETQQVTEKFAKREFVVTDANTNYPQDIIFQATQDKCSILDQFQVNDRVDIAFNIRGREWKSPQGEIKYFNSLEAWRIERAESQGSSMVANSMEDFGISTPSGTESAIQPSDEVDDLPF
ncbi:MAG: DUF3127 domain-containing protein [Flavobacteriales bacterium]